MPSKVRFRTKVPSYRHRKGQTQAIVTLTDAVTGQRRDFRLGEFGTPESREAYHRVIALWEANARRFPPRETTQSSMVVQSAGLCICEVILEYWRWAQGYYQPKHVQSLTVYDAKNGGAPHDIEALRAAVADEVTWRSAYECEFVDEAHALLPFDLLLARVDETLNYHLNMQALAGTGSLYMGYDVGRKADLSVLVVLERKNSGELRWVGAVDLAHSPFGEQFELISSIMKTRGVRRLCIDQSGLGMQLAEQAIRAFGERVEAVTMTAPVKEALASRILATFQRGDIRIPNYRPLIDDLHSVARTVTVSGNIRYAAPREAGSHADRWTALALALQAADVVQPTTIVFWGSQRPRDPDVGRGPSLREVHGL